jgi:hypothetical protein
MRSRSQEGVPGSAVRTMRRWPLRSGLSQVSQSRVRSPTSEVIDADRGQLRDFFAAQPRDLAMGAGLGQADFVRAQLGPTGLEEVAQFARAAIRT